MLNVLFVCSRNQWRSPTAEAVVRREPGLKTRSVGTSHRARRTVAASDIGWADVIVVMETKHRSRLVARFDGLLARKPLHVLHVSDDFRYMDPELVELLRRAVPALLEGTGE